jgi:hypothetical protein
MVGYELYLEQTIMHATQWNDLNGYSCFQKTMDSSTTYFEIENDQGGNVKDTKDKLGSKCKVI